MIRAPLLVATKPQSLQSIQPYFLYSQSAFISSADVWLGAEPS